MSTRKNKFLFLIICTLLFLNIMILPGLAQTKNVLVIPVEDTIEKGLEAFISRAIDKGEKEQVDYVIIQLDTPGGRLDAAVDIANKINHTSLTSIALIKGRAISAGSLLALSCDIIAMQPGSTLGDAEPYIGQERAGEKILSDWRGKLEATAEAKGRNPEIAAAFADRDIEIPDVIEKGKLLTLTPEKALSLGMADYIVKDKGELMQVLGVEDANFISTAPSMAEKIARLVTNPFVAPLLLTIGLAGLIIEVITAGFGFFGIIGLTSLALFFGGHLIAGFSGWGSVLLFLIGLILLFIEIFIPGFGIFGIGGIAALITSIFLISTSFEAALISLTIAIIGTIILVLISLKFLSTRGFWKRLILGNKMKTEEGYIASSEGLRDFVNKEGIALTDLRPAGTMQLDDGQRLDVVTSGEFIARESKIKVVKVEGNRIVVQKI